MTDYMEFMRVPWLVVSYDPERYSDRYSIITQSGMRLIIGVPGRELADHMAALHNDSLARKST